LAVWLLSVEWEKKMNEPLLRVPTRRALLALDVRIAGTDQPVERFQYWVRPNWPHWKHRKQGARVLISIADEPQWLATMPEELWLAIEVTDSALAERLKFPGEETGRAVAKLHLQNLPAQPDGRATLSLEPKPVELTVEPLLATRGPMEGRQLRIQSLEAGGPSLPLEEMSERRGVYRLPAGATVGVAFSRFRVEVREDGDGDQVHALTEIPFSLDFLTSPLHLRFFADL
jgi:hypothetical protein